MNRILFEKSEIVDGRAEFSGERAEHVLNVLHGQVGQTLKTGELDGLVGTSAIEEIRDLHVREEGSVQRGSGLLAGTVVVRCNHVESPPQPWFDLVLAPPRPRVLKRLLPQLAAMGVGRIVLTGARKTEKSFWGAQLLKPEVQRPLLIEGLMQGGGSRVPEIRTERNFRHYAGSRMSEEFAESVKIVAHPYAAGASDSRFGLFDGKYRDCRPVLAIGPEGGWTEEEVVLLERAGFLRHSLGPWILRTDTATVAAIAQLMTVFV